MGAGGESRNRDTSQEALAPRRGRVNDAVPNKDANSPMSVPAGPPAAVVFDAYGTLPDVHAAVARHAGRPGPQAARVSAPRCARRLHQSRILGASGPAHLPRLLAA